VAGGTAEGATPGIAGRLRIAFVIAVLGPVTLVLLPVQWLAVKRGWRLAGTLPVAWQHFACRMLRIRVKVEGEPSPDRPMLIVANHMSWLDILVIGTMMPVSFVAKAEVASWPLFGTLARLQRTIFIDRERRSATGHASRAIGERMADGDAIVLFAEGTTNDGNRLQPFRSALIGAARDALAAAEHTRHVVVQPLTVAYPRRSGLPVGRAMRPFIAWQGDIELVPHLVGILAGGPIDAVCVWGEPVAFDRGADRKRVTRVVEETIRRDYVRTVTGREPL
jgi:1-acyl-sn-glycerol-3-phosphate acyltransferase